MPITFSEWSLVTGSLVKRRDYYFASLTAENQRNDLFSLNENLKSDTGEDVFIPITEKVYEPTHYLKITSVDS